MDTPGSGRIAASGSYSSALLALKGRAAASCCVAAIFAVRSSEESTSGFGSAGPETVARLFGSMTDGASGRGFLDLAIKFSSRYGCVLHIDVAAGRRPAPV